MSDTPTGKMTSCPECNATAIALVPKQSEIVEREERADGKVRVDCRECGERFLVRFRKNRTDDLVRG